VLPWQSDFEKSKTMHTDFSYIPKYKNLRFITVTLLMLKNSKNQYKTYQFKTQCKGDINHASKTAKKITCV